MKTVVKKLWEYIKSNDLQNPKDRREILCDDKLRALFGLDSVKMFQMNKVFNIMLFHANARFFQSICGQKQMLSVQIHQRTNLVQQHHLRQAHQFPPHETENKSHPTQPSNQTTNQTKNNQTMHQNTATSATAKTIN